MILTVTPSPAVDWTVRVDSFELDAVNRITTSTREASGKGLNVSWALHRAGLSTHAVFPAGGNAGRFMADALRAEAVPHSVVPIDGETRTNITLVSPGHSTKINEGGTAMTSAQTDELTARVLEESAAARIVLVCGSLPPGIADDYPAYLAALLNARGVETVVDTSGAPLSLALAGNPGLIKPNVHELSELTGREIRTHGDVLAAARVAITRGARAVLASLGADGAMLVTADHAWFGRARDIPFVNSVGAGDALLAGFVAVDGTPAEALRNALLWASSAVAHETTIFPLRHDLADRIRVTDSVDESAVLTEPAVAEVLHDSIRERNR